MAGYGEQGGMAGAERTALSGTRGHIHYPRRRKAFDGGGDGDAKCDSPQCGSWRALIVGRVASAFLGLKDGADVGAVAVHDPAFQRSE